MGLSKDLIEKYCHYSQILMFMIVHKRSLVRLRLFMAVLLNTK